MKSESGPYLRVVVGIVAVAAIPPLGIVMFDGIAWLETLKSWQSGVGAFWGALFGLGAILIGAMANADLNRRRDERLREHEARALAAALYAEMLASQMIMEHMLAALKKDFEVEDALPADIDSAKNVWIPKLPVFNANLARLGIMGGVLDNKVVLAARRLESQPAMALYNLYYANTDRAFEVQRAIANVELTIEVIKETAEHLRIRAQLPIFKIERRVPRPVPDDGDADADTPPHSAAPE